MTTKRFLRQQWDRVLGWVAVALGAVSLLLGWLGVSDTVYPAEQIPYVLSGGIFGLFLVGLGGILLLSADLRDEWVKLDSIEDAIRETAIPDWDDRSELDGTDAPGRRIGRRPIAARRS